MSRIAVIDKQKCNPLGCGGHLCIKLCPVNRMGEECIIVGPDNKPIIDEKLCTGCGICPNRCPFDAISIINLPDELSRQPIHRYGKNGFHLYNLPIPQFGKVVGILGRNGIGKSTAIKILSGQLKPNLGKDTEVENYDKLIDYFKGTEAQIFFEKLKNQEITMSYKPQQVDLIPRSYKGKVRDLLIRTATNNKVDEIAEKLEISRILDNDISKISGGELQRVAIAATVLKEANIYFFDEPTSFLDIKQRIKVSKFIKSLASEKTAVVLVEHDLIILDYMTDLIHIMYGKEAAYGIVSGLKSTRTGINVYLDGFLKEENIRIRDKPIKFSQKPEEKKTQGHSIISWHNLELDLGNFHLEAKSGSLNKSDVIGVLGENGIGKTSFVKILAGVEKAKVGEIEGKVNVSYKPQYLESGSEELVMVLLNEAVTKYNNQLIGPLKIEPLLTRKINELSGGELQRVAIALCLSNKADIYLLDEPSAYLDIEQRLIISKVIGDFIEHKGSACMIVDHDLLFLDYLSKKLMVFEGMPAVHGAAHGPFKMAEGMNIFLKDLGITFRRDPDSARPRVNKIDSVMDREQKSSGNFYYS